MQYIDHSSQLELNESFLSILSSQVDSPEYHPSSPDLDLYNDVVPGELKPLYSERNLKRSKTPSPSKNLLDMDPFTNRENRQREEVRLLKDKTPPAPQGPKRKRKSKRQEAIDLFDVNAKPKNIGEFMRETMSEVFLPPVDLFQKENLTIETNEPIEDPVVHEELAIAELVAAKHNSTIKLDVDYGLNLKFNNDIEQLYIRSLEIEPTNYDLNDTGYRAPIKDLYNKELFIQRRLFSVLEHLQFSDQPFLKRHLPVHQELSRIDHTKLINDDENSFQLLRTHLSDVFKEHTTTKNLIVDNRVHLKNLEKLFNLKKYRRFQNYLIVAYLLFNDPKLISDRSKTVESIHPIFRRHHFRKSTIKSCFNACGIGFFDDYLSFNVVKPYIANLTEDRHAARLKTLKREKDLENRKKRRENVELDDLWF